ncbi:MAG: aminopeptidase P family N-terminal domain-containing protein, partial [Chloroflexota bacterium]|nr:aminopeptidase P family N-terminal domain-containing protein [Chloroflexota bacterium]
MESTNLKIYITHLQRARTQLKAHALDYLLVGPSADLFYLTGARLRPSERLSMLVVPQEGPASLVLPNFEAAGLPSLAPEIQVVTWGESANPARQVASIIAGSHVQNPGGAHFTIGVSDRLWSTFLLSLQLQLPRATFTSGSLALTSLRQTKSADEVALLARSGESADAVFSEICKEPLAGLTEMAI